MAWSFRISITWPVGVSVFILQALHQHTDAKQRPTTLYGWYTVQSTRPLTRSLINQPDGNAVVRQQRPPPPYSAFWTDIDGIFGLEAYIYTNCLALKPFKIYCRENEKGSGKELVTGCDAIWLNNARGIDNVEEYLAGLRLDIPSFLGQLVSAWTKR